MSASTLTEIDGRSLSLTNLSKVLWPGEGITKAALIEHYTRMAPVMLPYLRGRPLVLTRYPDGIEGKWFYQKDAPPALPGWIPTWGEEIRYMVAQEPAALAYVANLGAIELHPWLSRCEQPEHPDWAVIDLDPAEGCDFNVVLTAARLVRQLLAAVGITGLPKLSGATGIHIFCPCAPGHTYAETAGFCEAVGRVLLKVYPERITLERMVARRSGKLYVDFLQNRRGQTITAVYGLRPLPGAPVSAPVTWEEIEAVPPRFNIQTIRPRLERVGDLFAPLLTLKQDLRSASAQLLQML